MTPPSDPANPIACPVCEGIMEVVYDRPSQKVFVCADCHSGLTIPAGAWGVQQAKHSAKPKPNQ